MKKTRITLTVFRLLLTVEVIAFLYFTFRQVTGEVMTASGTTIIIQLLLVRYLSTVYAKYEYELSKSSENIPEPKYICGWAFEPLENYKQYEIDGYLEELLRFISASGEGVYVPKEDQQFKIWWENEASVPSVTSRVVKMIRGEEG